jgi:hypothetical protein
MRLLTIIAILAVMAASPIAALAQAPRPGPANQRDRLSDSQSKQPGKQAGVPETKPQIQDPAGSPGGAVVPSGTPAPNAQLPRWRFALKEAFAPANWSNWALVIVGFSTCIAALLTLSAIRTQAEIMQQQTEVTRKSVELFANAERARITVEVSRLGNFSIQFSAKNIGRTTARIIDSTCFQQWLDTKGPLPDKPEYLSLGTNSLLEATDSLAAGETFPLAQTASGEEDGGSRELLIADLSAKATRNNLAYYGHSMWIYGRIRYFDGISTEAREHRFCFKIRSEGENGNTWAVLGGPSAYRMDT